MKKLVVSVMIALSALTAAALTASAQAENPMVGGAPMYRTRDIIDNAVNSKDHTTLVAAVKAAGLVDTLKGKGPFTVFAPTNAAFDKLPAGTVDALLKPENNGMLKNVLTYHVVAGRYDSDKLMKLIKKGNGSAMLKTVSGGTLTFRMNGMNGISVTDEKGGTSNVSVANVYQSNGVIHVVDTVLMPGM
ncbi:MAG TPA: fasciclin domain-containing protein [Pyrinomonadaceae bacterium]|nr:fasciclin domain-containing protein [Pyrinomonadaceae bacterium]